MTESPDAGGSYHTHPGHPVGPPPHQGPGGPPPPGVVTAATAAAAVYQQQHLPSTLSRPFRSRKNRPCDACRKAKTRCAIPGIGPPCVECQQTGKQCTFDELPPARKRAPKRPASPSQGGGDPNQGYAPHASQSHQGTTKRARTTSTPNSINVMPSPLSIGCGPAMHGGHPHHQHPHHLGPPQHGLEALMHAATKERESQMRVGVVGLGGHPNPHAHAHLNHHLQHQHGVGIGIGPSPTQIALGSVLGTAGVVPIAISSSASASATAASRPFVNHTTGSPNGTSPGTAGGAGDLVSLDQSITPNLEPYAITALLTDDLLPINTSSYRPNFNGGNASEIPTEGYIRQISSDSSKPQYIIFGKRPENPPHPTPSLIPSTFTSILGLLPSPAPTIPALLTIYLKFSNPAFPLFIYPTPTPTPDSPPCVLLQDEVLQAKVSLASLSHSALFRPVARAARTILEGAYMGGGMGALGGVHGGPPGPGGWGVGGRGPNGAEGNGLLKSISLALLDLSARDREVRPFAQTNYIILASTIAQAQLLGLHIDCGGWTIPAWEKSLRGVLWWGLRVHDAWMSFLNSRPSFVQGGNTNVRVPRVGDVLGVVGPHVLAVGEGGEIGIGKDVEKEGESESRQMTPAASKGGRRVSIASPTSPPPQAAAPHTPVLPNSNSTQSQSQSRSRARARSSPMSPTSPSSSSGGGYASHVNVHNAAAQHNHSQHENQKHSHRRHRSQNANANAIEEGSGARDDDGDCDSRSPRGRRSLSEAPESPMVVPSRVRRGASPGQREEEVGVGVGGREESVPASASTSAPPASASATAATPTSTTTTPAAAANAASAAAAQPLITSAHSFILLCKLSLLVSHLQSQVCTLVSACPSSADEEGSPIKGMGVGREERVGRVRGIEGEAAVLLAEARTLFGAGERETGVASLMVCLLGFRCMLRRINIELCIGLGSPFTPDPETLDMYAEAVEYMCALDVPDFDSFWLPYVGHILSSLTSSLIRLSLATSIANSSAPSSATSPTAISAGPHHLGRTPTPHHQGGQTLQASLRTNPLLLLSRLINALHRAKQNVHWDMADAALQRAENVASCLRGGNGVTTREDCANVVAALEGRFESDVLAAQANAAGVKYYPGMELNYPPSGQQQQGYQQQQQQHQQQQSHQQQQQHSHQQHYQPPAHPPPQHAYPSGPPPQHLQQQQQQQQPLQYWENAAWNIDLNAFGTDWMYTYVGTPGGDAHGGQGQAQAQAAAANNANIDPAIRNANGDWE